MNRLVFFFLILFSLTNNVKAQYYDLGQDPASIKWNIIKTENFKIIYPTDFENNIQKLANALQYVYEYGTITLAHKPKQINVIIHTQSVVPNAFALWTPQRTEFFSCPAQNTYSQDWLYQLAIHEYRHMVQMDKLNQGFTKILTFLTGQHATITILGLFVPMWFMEGDAVSTETALSHSGRGRIPSFEMKSKAQVLEKGIYSFEKAQLGSSKDYVPDQYHIGYNFVSYTRKMWGAKAFQSALDYTGKYPFMITPFNHGLKKETGLSKRKMYYLIYDSLKENWTEQQKTIKLTPSEQFSPLHKIYTHYKFPNYLNDSIIIAERSGKDDISRVVIINRKKEEKILFTPGFYSSESISLSGNLTFSGRSNSPGSYTADNLSLSKGYICWAERDIDPRYSQRDYSVVKIFDLEKKKTIKLTKKSRYFAPYLFPDATRIAVSEVTTDNNFFLTIIDSKNGKVIKRFSTSDNAFFTTPFVSADNNHIISVALTEEGKSIISVNFTTGEITTLLKPSFKEISNATLYQNFVFYNGTYSGIDNIYAIDTLTKQIFQVTSAKYGASDIDISPNGKKFIYSDYTANGYQISEADYNPSAWIPISQVKDNSIKIFESYINEEKGIVETNTIPKKNYQAKPYRKAAHLFNFHSWTPFNLDADNLKAKPGISLMTQNLLGNMFGIIGYEWDRNTRKGKYHADLSYKGLYPIFDFSLLNGKSAGIMNNYKYTYHENNYKFGVSIPYNFLHKQFSRGFRFDIKTNYTKIEHDYSTPSNMMKGHMHTMEYKIFAYNQIKSVERNMRPRWGQSIEIAYKNTPFKGNKAGSIFSMETTLLFPGIIKHHSLMIYCGYQNKKTNDFGFTDNILYPKGYTEQYNDAVKTISFNYKFPFAYPDAHIGSLIYLKKLTSNMFFDYAEGTLNNNRKYYRSYGADILTNINFFRFFIPFYVGIRNAYIPSEKKLIPSFLFSVDFSGF